MKTEKYNNKIENIRYNLDSLENESTGLLYTRQLEQKLTKTESSTEEEYKHIKLCINSAAEEAPGK